MTIDTDTIKLSQRVTEASEALQAAQKALDDAVEALHRHLTGTPPKAAPKPKRSKDKSPRKPRSKGKQVRHSKDNRPKRQRVGGPHAGKLERYYRSALYGSISRAVQAGTPGRHTLLNGNVVKGVWLTDEERSVVKELAAEQHAKTPSGKRNAMRKRMRKAYKARNAANTLPTPANKPTLTASSTAVVAQRIQSIKGGSK